MTHKSMLEPRRFDDCAREVEQHIPSIGTHITVDHATLEKCFTDNSKQRARLLERTAELWLPAAHVKVARVTLGGR